MSTMPADPFMSIKCPACSVSPKMVMAMQPEEGPGWLAVGVCACPWSSWSSEQNAIVRHVVGDNGKGMPMSQVYKVKY
jgi:hypothetical protein